MTPTARESNEVAGGGWGKRNRGRERKPERGEGVSQGEEEKERGGEREVLHASSLRGGENKRPQRQFCVTVSGLKKKILDIQADRIKAQLRLLLSREFCDLRMGWISTGGLRRHR